MNQKLLKKMCMDIASYALKGLPDVDYRDIDQLTENLVGECEDYRKAILESQRPDDGDDNGE